MSNIEQPEIYTIYWHDINETILRCDVYNSWTWEDAYEGLSRVNQILSEKVKVQPVYVIFSLLGSGGIIPESGSTMENLRNFMKEDPSHEQLTIFIVKAGIINTLIRIASRAYGKLATISKLRIVTSLSEALEIIELHRTNANIHNNAI